MDARVRQIGERARAAGTARPASPVVTRTDDFRERGLTARTCKRLGCGIEFEPSSPNQLYHDVECRELHYRERAAKTAADDTPRDRGDDAPPPAVSGTRTTPESEADGSPARPGPASRPGASGPPPSPQPPANPPTGVATVPRETPFDPDAADELVRRYIDRLFELTDPESIVAKEVKVSALDKLDVIVRRVVP